MNHKECQGVYKHEWELYQIKITTNLFVGFLHFPSIVFYGFVIILNEGKTTGHLPTKKMDDMLTSPTK